MKFGYAIVLALVALVAVSGFASADRLPQQVPENQIFTISTLIDVTGAVSENSQMQWTIQSGDQQVPFTEAFAADLAAIRLTEAQANVLLSYAAELAATYGGRASDYIVIRNVAVAAGAGYQGRIFEFNIPNAWMNTGMGLTGNPAVAGAVYGAGLTFDDATFRQLIDNELGGLGATSEITVYGAIRNGMLQPGEEIALLTWTDSLRTNGGKLSLNKNIDFDSRNKGNGLYNLEVEKVLTYNSVEGAHLIGGEEWILDVAGSYEQSAGSIRCVFAAASSEWFPAFCNVVKAKSELININSAQISTKGQARAVAATGDIPAALNYQIAVSPDANTGSGFADGTVKTLFGGAIMEARGNSLRPAATNNWKDEASVTGGIKNFQKVFSYESGFTF